jgi:hypothetical protein
MIHNLEIDMEWISVKDRLPSIGEAVILFNGVVQKETYFIEETDFGDYGVELFWTRDDLDCDVEIKDDQMWMPLPESPALEIK